MMILLYLLGFMGFGSIAIFLMIEGEKRAEKD